MPGFGRENDKDAARRKQALITDTVGAFMEKQLDVAWDYRCFPSTPGQRAVAEMLMVGAIEQAATAVDARHVAQIMSAICNLLMPLFDYRGSESVDRAAVLMKAARDEANPEAADIYRIGQERLADFVKATEAGQTATLIWVGSTLAKLLREGREIRL